MMPAMARPAAPEVALQATLAVQPVTPALAGQLRALRVEPGQYGYVGDIQAALVEAEGDPHCEAMAVLLGERVVGFYRIVLAPLDAGLAPSTEARATLLGLCIARELQGRGLGTRALRACIDDLRRRHPQLRLLSVSVDCGNRRAIEVCRDAGFADVGVWQFGATMPRQMMQLRLQGASSHGTPSHDMPSQGTPSRESLPRDRR
jgi:RimJ/RimL family protein N-acetyltransferase